METSSEKTGIAIDGIRIRTIREEKKLTQLYVASVVGVTTDTISRWENNRYPTIKKENAEKLAAALDVPPDDIVRRDEPPPQEPPAPKKKKWLLPLVVTAGIILCLAALAPRLMPPAVTTVRWLPQSTPPGEVVPVQLKVKPSGADRPGLVIRETVPPGWRFVIASPPPTPDGGAGRELRWLIPGGTGAVTISYTVQAPGDAPLGGAAVFSGGIVVHDGGMSRREGIGGSARISVAPLHWADTNGDSRIDDDEIMPAYYLTEEMKGLGLDWSRIEALWSSKGYRWDGLERRFVVLP